MSKLAVILSGLVIAFFIWAGIMWWRVSVVECWFDGVLQAGCPIASQLQNHSLLTLNLDDPQWQTVKSFTAETQQNWQLTHWSKRLPNTVVLRYESSPGAYIVSLPDNSWWLVNQRGFLQSLSSEAASQAALTQVGFAAKWPAATYANYQIEPKLHTWLLQLDKGLRDSMEAPTKITLSDVFTMEVSWPTWQLIVEPFMSVDQLTERLAQINQLLAEKSQTLAADYKKLDLRFKLPVLEPKNPAAAKLFPSVAPKPTATDSASLSPTMATTPTKKPTPKPSPTVTVTPTSEPKTDQVKQ